LNNQKEIYHMRKAMMLAYGSAAYAAFLGAFLYAVGFLANVGVPKSIDSGRPVPYAEAILVNALLLGLFAIQHSGMARKGFKKVLTRLVPVEMERSTYVFATCAALGLMYWQWRPMPEVVWSIQNPIGQGAIWTLCAAGWAIVLLATIMIHHFDLFGMRQTWLAFRGEKYTDLGFRMPGFYRIIRHPIQVGFLLAFWSTPEMTIGHLFFSVMTTGYIFFAVKVLEERDLLREMGVTYRNYMRRVPGFLPVRLAGPSAQEIEAGAVAGD
jgi:protein-S-isoprenylcysteine O-methyltransferase Ste14